LALNVYEGLFIFDSNRYSRDQTGVSGQVAEMVRKFEGEVLVSRLWEERRLAYPIKGQRKGTYWLLYFRLDGKHLTAMERDCQLSESILRSLFIKIEPRIVDAIVSHASSASAADQGKARRPDALKPAEAETAVAVPGVDLEVPEIAEALNP
jgi:small subunit ribosomal protein S6